MHRSDAAATTARAAAARLLETLQVGTCPAWRLRIHILLATHVLLQEWLDLMKVALSAQGKPAGKGRKSEPQVQSSAGGGGDQCSQCWLIWVGSTGQLWWWYSLPIWVSAAG